MTILNNKLSLTLPDMRGGHFRPLFFNPNNFFRDHLVSSTFRLLVCTQLTYSGQVSVVLHHLFRNCRRFLGGYPIPPLISSQVYCETWNSSEVHKSCKKWCCSHEIWPVNSFHKLVKEIKVKILYQHYNSQKIGRG